MINVKEKDKALIFLPEVAVGIRVTRNVSAVIAHLIRHNIGHFHISLEDFKKDGATLVGLVRLLLSRNVKLICVQKEG